MIGPSKPSWRSPLMAADVEVVGAGDGEQLGPAADRLLELRGHVGDRRGDRDDLQFDAEALAKIGVAIAVIGPVAAGTSMMMNPTFVDALAPWR